MNLSVSSGRFLAIACWSVLMGAATVAVLQAAAPKRGSKAAKPKPDQIMVRIRVAEIEPVEYARLKWTWGSSGLTDTVRHGEVTAVPSQPMPSAERIGEGKDFQIEKTKSNTFLWVKKGVWLEPIPLKELKVSGGLPFLKIVVHGKPTQKGDKSDSLVQRCKLEFELSYQGQVLKTFQAVATDGPTVGLVIPISLLGEKDEPTPEFLERVGDMAQTSQRRFDFMLDLPWANRPLPKRYAIVSDCLGSFSNRNLILAELGTFQQLGGNGLRGMGPLARDWIQRGEGIGLDYRRIHVGSTGDYMLPSGKVEGAGCPYHPATVANRQQKVFERLTSNLERNRVWPVEESWLITRDEISAISGSHQNSCEHCQQAFREHVQRQGYQLADFGAASWDDIMTPGAYLEKAKQQGYEPPKKKKPGAPAKPPSDKGETDDAPAPDDPEVAGEKEEDDAIVLPVYGDYKIPVSPSGWALIRVMSRDFRNETSARLFYHQRLFYTAENEKKRQALAAGQTDLPEARQPWLYFYGLRRCTAIMGGDTLDCFDFYRWADNAFVYETSNRDPRVFNWDSYMSDLGRVLNDKFGTRYGIYVKPHRGAPIQRSLAAVSRGAKMIFWYTYGPHWAKGDNFSASRNAMSKCSWAARLIAAAEDVTYDGRWAHPAEVALVRLRTSETFEDSTSWENGKWLYTALLHAHIPVDPLSESMLLDQDLSRYKVIYVNGPNIRRAAAHKLIQWVEQGGTLYTCGGGLARDENNLPLKAMLPVLGLYVRNDQEAWARMPRYWATTLGKPKALGTELTSTIAVKGTGLLAGEFSVTTSRETLLPLPAASVLAHFTDGAVAVTRHLYGKGQAFVVGFHPGVEYAIDILDRPYETSRYRADKRAFVSIAAREAGVHPVVDAAEPMVEGVLIKNDRTGHQAVILINWGSYNDEELEKRAVPTFENLQVAIRGSGQVSKVRSAALEQDLPFRQSGNDITVTIPTMSEGEILLLE